MSGAAVTVGMTARHRRTQNARAILATGAGVLGGETGAVMADIKNRETIAEVRGETGIDVIVIVTETETEGAEIVMATVIGTEIGIETETGTGTGVDETIIASLEGEWTTDGIEGNKMIYQHQG